MATSGREMDERDRERIRKMREQGVPVRKVAAAMLVSPTTIQRVVKEATRSP